MKRVRAEDAKNSGEQQRKKRSHPGGGAGINAKWRTESVAGGEGVRDVAGLEEKRDDADALARMNILELPHVTKAKGERDEHDQPQRSGCGAK